MEMVRKIVNADMLTPIFDLPWASRGTQVEVIVFPAYSADRQAQQDQLAIQERRKRREELLDKYSIDLSNFKFNRDEANDYE
ncbi:MAG: hypothetical protein FWG84_07075 [Bacteroidales bacterium]|nr:hypothetical protein [Bacteroidales bacterium]